MAVEPAHELRRRVTPRQVLAGDIEGVIGLGNDGDDQHIVPVAQFRDRDVLAKPNMTEEAEAWLRGNPVEDPGDRLDLRVVGGDAAADQAEWGREAVEQVDADPASSFLQRLGGVETGRARSDYRDPQFGR